MGPGQGQPGQGNTRKLSQLLGAKVGGPKAAPGREDTMPKPSNKQQKGNCTIHAIVGDIAEGALENYGIALGWVDA